MFDRGTRSQGQGVVRQFPSTWAHGDLHIGRITSDGAALITFAKTPGKCRCIRPIPRGKGLSSISAAAGRRAGGLKGCTRLQHWRPYARFTATNEPPKRRLPSYAKTRPMIPRLPGLEPTRGGSHPVLSRAGHGAIPFTRNWAGSAVTTVPLGSRQVPGRAAGRRDPQVAPAPCASTVQPDHGHPAALQIFLRAFGMRSHGK